MDLFSAPVRSLFSLLYSTCSVLLLLFRVREYFHPATPSVIMIFVPNPRFFPSALEPLVPMSSYQKIEFFCFLFLLFRSAFLPPPRGVSYGLYMSIVVLFFVDFGSVCFSFFFLPRDEKRLIFPSPFAFPFETLFCVFHPCFPVFPVLFEETPLCLGFVLEARHLFLSSPPLCVTNVLATPGARNCYIRRSNIVFTSKCFLHCYPSLFLF